jgi:hypothetical protein
MSKDNKDMHQTGWMTPPKVDPKVKEAREIAKKTYKKARSSKDKN